MIVSTPGSSVRAFAAAINVSRVERAGLAACSANRNRMVDVARDALPAASVFALFSIANFANVCASAKTPASYVQKPNSLAMMAMSLHDLSSVGQVAAASAAAPL